MLLVVAVEAVDILPICSGYEAVDTKDRACKKQN